MPDTSATVDKLQSSLSTIAQETPGVINRFHEAFEERSTVMGLPESSERSSLSWVLCSILGDILPEKYYLEETCNSDTEADLDSAFYRRLCKAVEAMHRVDPYALTVIEHAQEKTGQPWAAHVRGALHFYAENRHSRPY